MLKTYMHGLKTWSRSLSTPRSSSTVPRAGPTAQQQQHNATCKDRRRVVVTLVAGGKVCSCAAPRHMRRMLESVGLQARTRRAAATAATFTVRHTHTTPLSSSPCWGMDARGMCGWQSEWGVVYIACRQLIMPQQSPLLACTIQVQLPLVHAMPLCTSDGRYHMVRCTISLFLVDHFTPCFG